MEGSESSYTLAFYCLPMIVGTILSSWANIHIKLDSMHTRSLRGRGMLSARKYLIFGIFLSILAALLDLSVVSSVPVTIRAGLASLSIPISVILARMILDEYISSQQALGVTLSIVGPFVSVLFASHDTSNKVADDWRFALSSERFHVFLMGFLPAFVISLTRLRVDPADPSKTHPLSLASCAFACACVGFTSNAASRFMVYSATHNGLWEVEFFVIFGITVGICVCQILAMSIFLSLYEASIALPMYQVFNSLIFTVGAVSIFEETIQSISGYVGGMGIAFVGLHLIAGQAKKRDEPDKPLIDVTIDAKEYNTFFLNN